MSSTSPDESGTPPGGATSEERSADAAEAANKLARSALVTAGVSVAISLISAVFAGWQAFESNRANNELQATKAANVYFDYNQGFGAPGHYSVVNRNEQPVANVIYSYTIDGNDAGKDVYIGTVPGCSSVRLTPQNGTYEHGNFEPSMLYFTDPSGDSWQRDVSIKVSESDRRDEQDPSLPRTVGATTPLTDGCQSQG